MMASFQGQVVIITGAGSGIGRAVSIKLGSLGASLALSDIRDTALLETVALCEQNNPGQLHITQAFDVGVTSAVNQFISSVVEKLGRIDHVFNCAGINPTRMPLETNSDDYWMKLMNTNLNGTFSVTRACIPHLKSGASFVNVSSIAGIKPSAGMAVYSATKAGIIGFSKAMALELGPKGIRTNVVAPGDIETPSNCCVMAGPEMVQAAARKVALGRLGTVDEVADVVIFLFGRGSQYMNGSVVEVNGGLE